jgi:hypothetical protein
MPRWTGSPSWANDVALTGESAFNLAEAWDGTSWSVVKTPHP